MVIPGRESSAAGVKRLSVNLLDDVNHRKSATARIAIGFVLSFFLLLFKSFLGHFLFLIAVVYPWCIGYGQDKYLKNIYYSDLIKKKSYIWPFELIAKMTLH